MYGCESWTRKTAEHWRIDAFELWCWKRLLNAPWTAGRSNQSILKEISPEYSLEGLLLKLKPQYFGHLIWRANSLERSDAGKDWGQEEKGVIEGKMLNGITDSMDVSLSKLQDMVKDKEAWHAAVHGVTRNWTRLSDWTATKLTVLSHDLFFVQIQGRKRKVLVSLSHLIRALIPSDAPPSSVQSLSRFQLFVTPWIVAHQASLSIPNYQSLPKLMSIELMMPSSHLILCCPLLLLPPIPPSIRVFSNESTLHMAKVLVAKVLEFQLQHQSSKWTLKTDLL